MAAAGRSISVPSRPPQPPATVAIIRDNSVTYASMVSQALEAALGPGGIGNLVHSGTSVLIKPNLVSNNGNAVTAWRVVKAMVDQIKAVNGGASITIADGSSTQDTLGVMAAQGYTAANFPGVTFANFNDTTTNPTNTCVLADSRTGANQQIPALVTDTDVYIDMPRMKTHFHAGITGAVKNLGIGTGPLPLWTLSGANSKAGMHHDIRSEIVDHIACRVPDLSVMDAISAMEGQGPSDGAMVTMNMVLASKDPVALDAVAATIMGIPPSLIAHLELAANENIGVIDLARITTTGNITLSAASAIHTFVRATPGNPLGSMDPGSIPYRATTVIRPAPAVMNIDGDLSEWWYANKLTADAAYQVKGSSASWGGTSDSSFTTRTLYDAQNLYLAVQVKDDVKRANPNTGAAIVNGDGVELYLGTFAEQYATSRGTTFDSRYDYHLAISHASAPRGYMMSHNRPLTGAVISEVDTGDGYIIEAMIPWSNFGGPSVTPAPLSGGYTEYRQLGLNVALDDADSSSSTVDHKLMWANATDSDIETNPQKLGMSYVDPPGGLYPPLTFTLTTSAVNGTVTRSPDQPSYTSGTVVRLTATPAANYRFTGWGGSASGTVNPLDVVLDSAKSITANFEPVPLVLTSIVVTPATVSMTIGATQQFSATAYDQNLGYISPQPSVTWGVSGGGSIDAWGLFTAGPTVGGPFTVTAQNGSIKGTAAVTVSNTAPMVAAPAAAAPSPTTGTATALSVLGADDGGEPLLVYTWTTTGTPPAVVRFSTNGSNASKSTTATFTKAGTYLFQVVIADQGNLTTTSTVSVRVEPTTTTVTIVPVAATVAPFTTQRFTASARDQFSVTMVPQPTFTWTVSGGGSVDGNGSFTAGATGGGPHTVTARSGGRSGTATVTVDSASTCALTVSTVGTGSGKVTSSPAGVDCGATCTASFASGTRVTLTATAASGATFGGYGGACSGLTCDLTVRAATAVTATFIADTPAPTPGQRPHSCSATGPSLLAALILALVLVRVRRRGSAHVLR